MWVCVTDDFGVKQLIIKIINSANDVASADAPAGQQNLNKLDMEQLQNHLRNKLAGQKFLLVLDDVWNEDRVKWVELRDLMQVGAKRSKILVTTRSHKIASMMGTVPSHISQCLSEKDSLSVFVKWAFKEGADKRYPGLVEIGKDIVKKCHRNPLALRTLGSSLFSKVDINEWIYVRDNGIWNLGDDIMSALKLSYDQMPSYLKQCFAFFSLYPKGYTFDSFSVASLWGSFGLLPSPNNNQVLKHGANQCLNELHSRSFLQHFVDYGIGFSFKMHGLVHDLAKSVAGGYDELRTYRYQYSFWFAGFVSWISDLPPIPKLGRVRTILFPVAGVGANSGAFLNRVSKWKYLRFLDLSDSTYETLPRSIGKLKHLRYLSLENNKRFKRLPNSFCKLHKLEVLILSGCILLETLPKGLRNLISLQHLEITTRLCVLPEDEIAHLSSLQTLRIEFCDNLETLFGGIRLPTLRVLVITSCCNLKSLPLNIEHFPELETLLVDNCEKLELSEGHNDQNSNLRLKVLNLISMPQLETLPHWLQGSVKTLQYLLISSCNNLVVLPEWLSTMNCLKTLCITNCPNMLSLPNDIHCLTAIERFEIDGFPEIFRKSQPQVGECSHKHTSIDEPEELEEEDEELE